MLIERIKKIVFIVGAVFLSACGGGSSSDSSNDSASIKTSPSLTLTWEFPHARENGKKLTPTDIQGSVVLHFNEAELSNYQEMLHGLIPSSLEFTNQNFQIGRFISGFDLPNIISSGSPNAIVIYSSEQSTYTFHNIIDKGVYYYAVSCFDWENLYSELSHTIRKNV